MTAEEISKKLDYYSDEEFEAMMLDKTVSFKEWFRNKIIQQERERCAKIAEEFLWQLIPNFNIPIEIAKAIREQG